MNENIDLTKILQDCPDGWEFFTPICGEVKFSFIKEFLEYPINMRFGELRINFSKEGFYFAGREGAECLIFPSREQRDWSKFTAPWYKKDKFDPKTLSPFDKVIGRDSARRIWDCDFFSSHIGSAPYPYRCVGNFYKCCIPYNDDTKHLVGKTDEAPEYYRYWED